jgi:hypothetical protein
MVQELRGCSGSGRVQDDGGPRVQDEVQAWVQGRVQERWGSRGSGKGSGEVQARFRTRSVRVQERVGVMRFRAGFRKGGATLCAVSLPKIAKCVIISWFFELQQHTNQYIIYIITTFSKYTMPRTNYEPQISWNSMDDMF